MLTENKLDFATADMDTEYDIRDLVEAMKRLQSSRKLDTLKDNLPYLLDETDKWNEFLIKLEERKAA